MTTPIVEVYYDELTYEMLKEEIYSEQIQVSTNRPSSPLQRLTQDIFGLLALYGLTFVVCDLLRTMKTGNWTSLVWMFIGPWKSLTGAPLITKLAEKLGYTGQYTPEVIRCRNAYDDAALQCQVDNVFDHRALTECMDAAMATQQSCIAATEEYQDCVYTMTDREGYNEKYGDQWGILTSQNQPDPEEHCMNNLLSTYGAITIGDEQ